jgi:hypothetical protein
LGPAKALIDTFHGIDDLLRTGHYADELEANKASPNYGEQGELIVVVDMACN